MKLRLGVMTGGGDCPGLNAVIRAVVRRALLEDRSEVLGIKNGWRGLIEGDLEVLSRKSVTGILPRGGTILGTSRVNPKQEAGDVERIRANWESERLDALVVIGGEGTLRAARDMWRDYGLAIVGVPKTMTTTSTGRTSLSVSTPPSTR